jgi:hypothetical protein
MLPGSPAQTLYVVTTVFKDGFETQSRSLGFAGAAVYVAHPVQNRTNEELRRLADESFQEILGMITGTDGG